MSNVLLLAVSLLHCPAPLRQVRSHLSRKTIDVPRLYGATDGGCKGSEVLEIRHRGGGLVGLACGADGGVKVGPLLGFVLGFEEMADGAEAAGAVG
jgi:hypothetical protein